MADKVLVVEEENPMIFLEIKTQLVNQQHYNGFYLLSEHKERQKAP